MANIKITDLTAYTDPAATDVLPIVDVGADVTKKVSIQDLLENAGSGTAAAPGIAFDGDSNTGIYRPGADQVALSTNGTGRVFVDANGNVGIGVTSPTDALQVANGNILIGTGSSSAGYRALYFGSSTTTSARFAYIEKNNDSPYDFNIVNSAASAINFKTTPTSTAVTIDSSGRLGIGTSSPDGLLTVRPASGNAQVFIRTNDTTSRSQLIFGDSADANTGGIQYNHTTDNLEFHVGNLGEKMTLDATGRLGIGTTSPGFKTEIVNTLEADSNLKYSLAIRGDDSGTAGESSQIFLGAINNTARGAAIAAVVKSTANDHDLVFKTSAASATPSERCRIDSSGRLLVGTSSARNNFAGNTTTPLVQIEGVTAATASSSVVRGAADTTGPTFNLGKTRGASVGQHTVVASGDQCGVITFQGADGTNLIRAAQIAAEVDGTPGANDMPGRLVFSVTADGESSPTERMRITNAGGICINRAGVVQVGNSLAVQGNGTNTVIGIQTGHTTGTLNALEFTDAAGNNCGEIIVDASANTTNYSTTSDYRLKENVVRIENSISRLNALKPCRFNFISDLTRTFDGFLAHEAQEVVPEAVNRQKDQVDSEGNPEYQTIDQSKLVPLLTAALQEAVAKIESLEASNTDLLTRVSALESA